jgi:SAM-dependent methyltransferase
MSNEDWWIDKAVEESRKQRKAMRTLVGFENPTCEFESCYGPKGIVDGDLGGTTQNGDCNSWHPEVWARLIDKYNIQSMLDIGCGVGLAQSFFEKNSIINFGIDGTEAVKPFHRVPENFEVCDITKGPYYFGQFDLVWSCDVFEHIPEDYVWCITDTIQLARPKVVAFAAAPEGCDGHHHVNCKNPDYWIDVMHKRTPLKYNDALTRECRARSPLFQNGRKESYFARSGLIFDGIRV